MSERFDTFSPGPAEPDPWETAAEVGAAEEDAELDPGSAAALFDQARRRAKRRLELRPPWLTLTASVVVLVCYGALWLSVRGQHPYTGPAGWALAVLYGTLALWAVVNAVVLRRATSGVGGRAARQRAIVGPGVAVIWICVYVVQGRFITPAPTARSCTGFGRLPARWSSSAPQPPRTKLRASACPVQRSHSLPSSWGRSPASPAREKSGA